MNKINAIIVSQQNRPISYTSANKNQKADKSSSFVNLNLNKDLAIGFPFLSILWGAIMGNIEYDKIKNETALDFKKTRIAGKVISGFFAGLGACLTIKFIADKINQKESK